MKLESLGWDEFFETRCAEYRDRGLVPGRVAIQHRDRYIIYSEQGEVQARVSGKFRFAAAGPQAFPAVGDWVVFEPAHAVIHHILERRSKFSRKSAGERTDEQILAANIDVIFLVMGLDGDYNVRRLERYLVAAKESNAQPVIILNKSDLCESLDECIGEVQSSARGTEVCAINARQPDEAQALLPFLPAGRTGILVGSSGVGKSTITNALLGSAQVKVQEVRSSDSHGRHTTAHRELLVLAGGGIIIDTPGLRELQLWESDDGIQESFDDIDELTAQCRFRDCRHEAEPGCAVKQVVEDGTIDSDRYRSYQKLQREQQHHAAKVDALARKQERERSKKFTKIIKATLRYRDKP